MSTLRFAGMLRRRLDLTTALRPTLDPDEALLFLQDGVGLYEGKDKIPSFQDGQAYLTSHRICYVGHDQSREHSAAISLRDVERFDLQAGFLKSSPKISLYAKPPRSMGERRSSSATVTASARSPSASPSPGNTRSIHSPPPAATDRTWICLICSFSNPMPSNFDVAVVMAHTPVPPCLSCGVTPPLTHILKAAIAQTSPDGPSTVVSVEPRHAPGTSEGDIAVAGFIDATDPDSSISPKSLRRTVSCPRCTFVNHPSLKTCEICGAALPSAKGIDDQRYVRVDSRSSTPGGVTEPFRPDVTAAPDCIKLSFRAGGDKIFHERLKGAMVQRKWLLHGAPPVPRPDRSSWSGASTPAGSGRHLAGGEPRSRRIAGLAGLQQRDLTARKHNEIIIGSAFEDLDALMASAKEIVALAEKFSGVIGSAALGATSEASDVVSRSATALGLMTTKDVLGSGGTSESLYLSELARNLAEFLTDDATGVLRREGGIMSLVDLWAVFNRARGGVELVSPLDFHKAALLWEKLNLPLRLRRFKSGLLVVQGQDRTDDKTIDALLGWLRTLHDNPSAQDRWDVPIYGQGVTPQEAAERFGWSVGVANEELSMAEERGVLCREQGVEGLRFWENWLTDEPRRR